MILENIDGHGLLNFRVSHEILTIKVLNRNNKPYIGHKLKKPTKKLTNMSVNANKRQENGLLQ